MINTKLIVQNYTFMPSSAGTDFRRQNLTSNFRRKILKSKIDPGTERVKYNHNDRRSIT